MSDAATNFLGSGFAFPFRAGPAGLPDVKFATGEDLVAGVVKFLMDTVRGDLVWDPGVGMNPEYRRHDALDHATVAEMERDYRYSLGEAEPRIRDVTVKARRDLNNERMDTDISFRTIEAPVASNDVRLPLRGQQDILRVHRKSALPIQGYADALSIISGIGDTGNE